MCDVFIKTSPFIGVGACFNENITHMYEFSFNVYTVDFNALR